MKKTNGFTLVEVILAIAVLAIIAFIAIPKLANMQRNSQVKTDLRNSEQIGEAARMWLTEGLSDEIIAKENLLKEIKIYSELSGMEKYITTHLKPVALNDGEFYLGLTEDKKIKVIISDEENKETTDIYTVTKGGKAGISYIENKRLN